MKTDYAIIRKSWNGIEIEIRWNADYLAFEGCPDMAHLEIESLSPPRAPLPMTETGYRSHFIHAEEVERFGGPEAYVEAWITELSDTATWRQTDAATRQLALFCGQARCDISCSDVLHSRANRCGMRQIALSPALVRSIHKYQTPEYYT